MYNFKKIIKLLIVIILLTTLYQNFIFKNTHYIEKYIINNFLF